MGDILLKYCPHCLGNDIIKKNSVATDKYYFIHKGFMALKFGIYCPICECELITMNLTMREWHVISCHSTDQDFIFALDKLKKDDPIEFTLKFNQFLQINKNNIEEEKRMKNAQSNTPKCPTCGSTNIKKISGTKRWVGTGLFGLASSLALKSYECLNCSYKW